MNNKRFAGILLAAGSSERFGSPKVLLDWGDEPLIRFLAKKVISFDLSPVNVVSGPVAEIVDSLLSDLPVTTVYNARYKAGIGTSLSRGIRSLTDEVDGVFVFLGDQPFIKEQLVEEMKDVSDKGDVIFPVFNGTMGHPVLWNSQTFPRLKRMYIGETGRSIRAEFGSFPLKWVSNEILIDIDTQDDYALYSNQRKES